MTTYQEARERLREALRLWDETDNGADPMMKGTILVMLFSAAQALLDAEPPDATAGLRELRAFYKSQGHCMYSTAGVVDRIDAILARQPEPAPQPIIDPEAVRRGMRDVKEGRVTDVREWVEKLEPDPTPEDRDADAEDIPDDHVICPTCVHERAKAERLIRERDAALTKCALLEAFEEAMTTINIRELRRLLTAAQSERDNRFIMAERDGLWVDFEFEARRAWHKAITDTGPALLDALEDAVDLLVHARPDDFVRAEDKGEGAWVSKGERRWNKRRADLLALRGEERKT